MTDRDILDYLLTPSGFLCAAILGISAAALLLLEQAGIMVLVARAESGTHPRVRSIATSAVWEGWRITQLGMLKLWLLLLTLTPFVALLFLTQHALLSRHDINYYLAGRPPVFWVSVVIGGLVGLVAIAAGLALLVRWSFALPILLFEQRSPRDALRDSRARVRGIGWRVCGILFGWQFCLFLLSAGVNWGFGFVVARLPDGAAEGPAVLAILLIARAGLLAVLSAAVAIGQAVFVRRIYLDRTAQLGLSIPVQTDAPSEERDASVPWSRSAFVLALAVLFASPVGVWIGLLRSVEARTPVQVTAHRGHERGAPENTRSAIQGAIDSGADYAEVDVQRTADGHVVLVHDRDLKRVTGDPRRIDAVTFAELRTLDAGSWFGPAFAGERVPTLAEIIELSRGRIKLNIELKFYGRDRRLAAEVARLVGEMQFETDCVVTSFSHEALLDVRRANARIRTGVIVAAALGDVTQLEGEVLSIQANRLTDPVLRAAHRRGMEVHVWTVNDERQVVRLMLQGVDNIITSDPDLLIRVRRKWTDLTAAERLVLASRVLLGMY